MPSVRQFLRHTETSDLPREQHTVNFQSLQLLGAFAYVLQCQTAAPDSGQNICTLPTQEECWRWPGNRQMRKIAFIHLITRRFKSHNSPFFPLKISCLGDLLFFLLIHLWYKVIFNQWMKIFEPYLLSWAWDCFTDFLFPGPWSDIWINHEYFDAN